MSALNAASSRQAPLRLGIVGSGLIASVTARAAAAAPDCRVVAVSARRPGAARAFADEHGIAQAFDDWNALLASPDIDAVYVATPTAPREAICVCAAQLGKHVLAEKPFASLASLRRITAACRQHGVAFLDATHFVHHPRTAQLKAQLAERIGAVQAVRSGFFFPSMDRGNIRFNPAQEPTGAIGDMAWYAMRAVVEYGPADAALVACSGFVQHDPASGAAVRGAGVLMLAGGCTSTWDAGYNSGAFTMDLQLLGERGAITLDDFVLDWAHSAPPPLPDHAVGFSQRAGVVNPAGFEWVDTPATQPQNVAMIEHFTRLARDPRGAAAAASARASERTQGLLDAVWQGLRPV